MKKVKKILSAIVAFSTLLTFVPCVNATTAESSITPQEQTFIDLSGVFNNHVTGYTAYYDPAYSTTNDSNGEDKNVGYHKDRLILNGYDSGAGYNKANGLSNYTIKGIVDPDETGNTTFVKNGIKFDFKKLITINPGLTNEPDSIRIKGSGKTIPVNGSFSKIYFAAAARRVINSPAENKVFTDGIDNYEVTVNYTDGTSNKQTMHIEGAGFGNSYMEVDNVNATTEKPYVFKVKDGKTLPDNFLFWSKGGIVWGGMGANVSSDFSLCYYTVNADLNKTVESVTFNAQEGTYDDDLSLDDKDVSGTDIPSNEILLFAMTGSVEDKEKIKLQISKLPDSVTEENMNEVELLLYDVAKAISDFEEKGGNRSDISNIAKYESLKASFPNVESINTTNDDEFVTVTATFSALMDNDTVNAYMLEDNETIEAVSKTFTDSENKTTAVFKFKHYKNYDKKHTFVVKSGAKATSNGLIMLDKYTKQIDITPVFGVTSSTVTENNGKKTVSVTLDCTNLTGEDKKDYVVIMGIYGENNILRACKVISGTLTSAENSKDVKWEDITLPEGTSEANIKCFVVGTDGKTLFNPVSFK